LQVANEMQLSQYKAFGTSPEQLRALLPIVGDFASAAHGGQPLQELVRKMTDNYDKGFKARIGTEEAAAVVDLANTYHTALEECLQLQERTKDQPYLDDGTFLCCGFFSYLFINIYYSS
jgi:hypothetical protein